MMEPYQLKPRVTPVTKNIQKSKHHSERSKFFETIHFKIEILLTVLHLIREGDFLISVDLRDAYFNIPFRHLHRKYIRFTWKYLIHIYEFQCLPFGLRSAPRIFTNCTKPLMSFLRTHGHRGVF